MTSTPRSFIAAEHRGRASAHAHQDHVGLARERASRRAAPRSSASSRSRSPRRTRRLARELVGVLEREQRRLGVEGADVVGRPHLVDLVDQRRRPGQVAEAHAGQAELAERAQHQHVRQRAEPRSSSVRDENGW